MRQSQAIQGVQDRNDPRDSQAVPETRLANHRQCKDRLEQRNARLPPEGEEALERSVLPDDVEERLVELQVVVIEVCGEQETGGDPADRSPEPDRREMDSILVAQAA